MVKRFDKFVLYAWSIGIGTVWIGGTMDRPAFERAMAPEQNERMPCVSHLEYPAGKLSFCETMMQKAVRADSRNPLEKTFFENTFEVPLTEEKAGYFPEAFPMDISAMRMSRGMIGMSR